VSKIAKAKNLPQWCADIISNPPRSGEGFHNWLFLAARALWKCGRGENDIRALLENAADGCGRRVTAHEIDDAIKNSQTNAFQGNPANQWRPWPAFNPEKRKSAIANGYGLADLWESSPLQLEDNAVHTETIIDRLFPGNPLLCVGKSMSEFDTRTREQWRGDLWSMALIVPSPMTERIGLTRDRPPKKSAHALSITGPRRFLVIEQDRGTLDEQAAVLLHLAIERHAPLAIAVHSGGKSIHGWFYCAGRSEELLRRFMEYAVEIGADRTLWTRSQFARMPDGRRDNGRRQRVYFLSPEAVK
jgi:hypothetical protein